MIKITQLTDIWKAESIPDYIKHDMEKQMLKICKDYITENISEFGAFYFICSKDDLNNYQSTGMTERIEDTEPEWIRILKDKQSDNCCMQGCYVIDNDYSIYIFCEEKLMRSISNHQDIQNKT